MRGWLAALAALTLLRFYVAAVLPLVPDEAYYFLWSRHLQPGYFDHPPMVALLIRAGSEIFGPTPFGIRFFAPVLAALGSLLIWDAGENFWPGRKAGLIAAALLNATLMVNAGAVLMTPDTPLLFAWTAGLAALARLAVRGQKRWWLAAGAALGLALLAKYTALLFAAAAFFWTVFSRRRRDFLTPWPWAGLALALLFFAPDIYWNATHGWVSFLKQGGRVAGFDPARALQFLAEFLGGQFALATPLIAGLAALGVWRAVRADQPAGPLLAWLTLIPLAVFLEHTLTDRVQANWAAIMYPSACLAAAALPVALLRRWLRPALWLGFAVGAATYLQALTGILPLPVRLDPIALQADGWPALAAAAAAQKPSFVTSDEYATAAMLAYKMPATVPVVGFDRRWWFFDLPAAAATGRTGLLVTRRRDARCADEVGTAARTEHGRTIMTYRLCRITATHDGVLLPRP